MIMFHIEIAKRKRKCRHCGRYHILKGEKCLRAYGNKIPCQNGGRRADKSNLSIKCFRVMMEGQALFQFNA